MHAETLAWLIVCALVAGCREAPTVQGWARPAFCAVDETRVQEILESMSVEERAAQVLMVTGSGSASGPSMATLHNITELGVGGIFLQPVTGLQMRPEDTARLVHGLQEAAMGSRSVPLLVSVDQEGGHAAALNSLNGGIDTPGSLALGQARQPAYTFDCFDIMGEELSALGFNMDFAPVLDILPDDRNGAMNTRGFGDDPGLVAGLAPASVWGLQNHRVLGTIKHAPGIGLTGIDTHADLPIIEVSREEFDATTLHPFRRAIEAGALALMTGHVVYTAVDPVYAASMSPAFIRGLLREELGFEGLVVTDSIGMAGARLGAGGEEPAARAVAAGNDMVLLMDETFEEAFRTRARIVAAVEEGRLAREDLDAAVRKVLEMKMITCAFENPYPDVEAVRDHVGTQENATRAQAAADASIVLLREEPGVLPLSRDQRILFIGPSRLYRDPGTGWMNLVDRTLGEALDAHSTRVTRVESVFPPAPAQAEDYLPCIEDSDVVVIATINSHYSDQEREYFAPLFPSSRPVVLVTLGVPYDAWSFPGAGTVLNASGQRSVSLIATARVLFGLLAAQGRPAVDMENP